MHARIVGAFLSALLFACSARGEPFDCTSTAGTSCELRLSICPMGDFELLRNGCGGTGDYVWVIARDDAGHPIPGIPPSDFWMNACDPSTQLCLCVEAVLADSFTGPDGRTTFSGSLRAGGCVPTGGLWIAVQGGKIKERPYCVTPVCLDIVIKSPDLTGTGGLFDCVVNISDLVPFGASYNAKLEAPGYNDCCDYNDDSWVNLADFAFFAQHYQHQCLW